MSKSTSGFGQRLRALRESLDPKGGAEEHVSGAALCRLFAPSTSAGRPQKHLWTRWERKDIATVALLKDVDYALVRLADALDVKDSEKLAEQLCRYVRQGGKLPWSSPPAWKEGRNPNRNPGRPVNARVIDGRVYRPGQEPPAGALETSQALVVHRGGGTAGVAAPSPELDEEVWRTATLAMLQQVAAGSLAPEAALEVIGVLSRGHPPRRRVSGVDNLTLSHRRRQLLDNIGKLDAKMVRLLHHVWRTSCLDAVGAQIIKKRIQ